MNILCELEHSISETPLKINVQLSCNNQTLFDHVLDLSKSNTELSIAFVLTELVPQKLKLSFATADLAIVKHPLTITKIVLDDFYSIDKILYSGHSKFDDNFLSYAESKQIVLEENICDANCLDFTGSLDYYFDWPFYKNIFTNFRKYREQQ